MNFEDRLKQLLAPSGGTPPERTAEERAAAEKAAADRAADFEAKKQEMLADARRRGLGVKTDPPSSAA